MNEHEAFLRKHADYANGDRRSYSAAKFTAAADEIKRLSAKRVEVHQNDWIPAWAGFVEGSTVPGPVHIALNLGAFLASIETGESDKVEMPYEIAETIMHEVMHALEEWAGVEFSDEKIEALLVEYRKGAVATTDPRVVAQQADPDEC